MYFFSSDIMLKFMEMSISLLFLSHLYEIYGFGQ
jgi:hypothetical protein